MKRALAIFIVALFFAACQAHEVTKVGNPNLDETQDVTQIGSPTTLPGGSEEVTQIGSPTTTPGTTEAALATKALLQKVAKWEGGPFSSFFNVADMRVTITSSDPNYPSTESFFKITDDGSVETELTSGGYRLTGVPDEEDSGLKIVESNGNTLVSLVKATTPSPETMKNAKDTSPTEQLKKYKNLPKPQSN